MEKALLLELKSGIEYMSGVEKKIAETILLDPKKFTTYSMQELSSVAEVSQGSIINFANKFCGGGFPILKMQVALSLGEEKWSFSGVNTGDSVKEILVSRVNSINVALKNTIAINNESSLLSVAEKILKAKRVEIYGISRSAVVATDLYYQLLQMGIHANFVNDVLTCAVSASLLTDDCLVIAISSSGRTKDIIDAVKLAKKNNVSVACITSNRNSPLAKLSDDVLVAGSNSASVSGSWTEVRISQLVLTEALCAYVLNKTDNTGEKYYANMEEILTSHNVQD